MDFFVKSFANNLKNNLRTIKNCIFESEFVIFIFQSDVFALKSLSKEISRTNFIQSWPLNGHSVANNGIFIRKLSIWSDFDQNLKILAIKNSLNVFYLSS